ncbi:MAG: putative lipid II flippase FtsW [Gammaproteobacteria bacterium]|jgi:cell division protein FtsW|nr:putative lipid II flippase FtsW [Gammaproteobacteria bacterium]MBT3859952.1 putative lipid II flippase FtsW [Gammaproteobacteria bacterium]MBT3986414.1 putative lipid II flippase FtsW [Gammaproteobacteria bacterium]MBT4582974.1 putative lipid II flippase FtsW [Gammaproteobacteria bacterium]MBT4658267.1 putative lipid II flippase FtsW [Gammaproteobacteria bacterium]
MTMARTANRPPRFNKIEEEKSLNLVLFLTLMLLTSGLLMMTSASVEIASSRYGDPFYHLKRQGIFAAVGIVVMFVTLNIPLYLWKKFSWFLLMASYALLLLVLVPGVGKVVNGSARWIDLGIINLQPSELAKVFIIIYLASFLERHLPEVQESWSGFIKPLGVISAAVVLLHFEPDHGAMVILLLTAFCMIFLAGAKFYRFLFMLVICSGAVVAIAITKPYVLVRFSSYLNPWAAENVYGGGYQLTQALIAFGRGEWLGVGLGNSIQKLYFLPEAHTDFVLAIIGEELGLFGVGVVILLFTLLVYKAFSIGKIAHLRGCLFEAFFAYGLGLLFAGQALINIGVNIGLLPTKGLTLPFLSQGGASLIVSCFMIALLVRIQYETEYLKPASTSRKAKE